MNILVVDDDSIAIRALARQLEHGGHFVTPCTDPGDALELTSSLRFGVALVDLCLGAVDGADVVREIQARSPRTRTMILTGQEVSELDDLPTVALQKPIRSSKLLQEIAALTSSSSCLPRGRNLDTPAACATLEGGAR